MLLINMYAHMQCWDPNGGGSIFIENTFRNIWIKIGELEPIEYMWMWNH